MTEAEHAADNAERQRPSPQGYADELPEERGWRIGERVARLVRRFL